MAPCAHPAARHTAGGVTTIRRTQTERSATTRSLLISAAVDSLVERGWAATTAVEVCARAGVTRGAFNHHFSSRPVLLAGALQSIYDQMAIRSGPAPSDLAELLQFTWRAISSPHFKAMLEAWLAMTNDPGLAEEIGPVVQLFATLASPDQLTAGSLDFDDERRTYYLMAREAMLGLAVGRSTNGGRPLGHESAVLAALWAGASKLDASPE
jgi:AcrR family transcriptional regulator